MGAAVAGPFRGKTQANSSYRGRSPLWRLVCFSMTAAASVYHISSPVLLESCPSVCVCVCGASSFSWLESTGVRTTFSYSCRSLRGQLKPPSKAVLDQERSATQARGGLFRLRLLPSREGFKQRPFLNPSPVCIVSPYWEDVVPTSSAISPFCCLFTLRYCLTV